MTSTQIALCVLAALLVFWAVGAYNRLVNLRSHIVQAFAAVDVQLQLRHALLARWLQAMPMFVEHAPQAAESVQAACSQLQAACDALRQRPGTARPATSLRLAEETLAAARGRFNAELPARPELLAGVEGAVLADELAAADSTLGFARKQFNDATGRYNLALQQFPTRLLAWLFGFRAAGTL